jgi:DNA invertase Pin-like site-specific DNA recombinase
VNTATSWGKHTAKLFGWVAEVEMTLRRERQAAGIQKAKAAGKYKGRKRKATPEKIAELKTKGLTMAAIARELGVSRQAVYKAVN